MSLVSRLALAWAVVCTVVICWLARSRSGWAESTPCSSTAGRSGSATAIWFPRSPVPRPRSMYETSRSNSNICYKQWKPNP